MKFNQSVKMMVAVCCLSPGSSAAVEEAIGAENVRRIAFQRTQDVIVITRKHRNPDNCTQASAVLIDPGHLAYVEMVGTVLAATTTHSKIVFSVDGCIAKGVRTYPLVSSLTWE